MSAPAPQAKVGVGVLLIKRDPSGGPTRILVGQRKGSHGAGTYACPGGHLEYLESFEECAAREVLEETGIVLPSSLSFGYATNNVIDGSKHYVTIFMKCEVPEDTQAQLLEPEKCEAWIWAPYKNLPQPLFAPLEALLNSKFELE